MKRTASTRAIQPSLRHQRASSVSIPNDNMLLSRRRRCASLPRRRTDRPPSGNERPTDRPPACSPIYSTAVQTAGSVAVASATISFSGLLNCGVLMSSLWLADVSRAVALCRRRVAVPVSAMFTRDCSHRDNGNLSQKHSTVLSGHGLQLSSSMAGTQRGAP